MFRCLDGNNPEAQRLLAAMMHGGKTGSPKKSKEMQGSGYGYGNGAQYDLQKLQQTRHRENNGAQANPLKSLREKLAILKFELEEKRQVITAF